MAREADLFAEAQDGVCNCLAKEQCDNKYSKGYTISLMGSNQVNRPISVEFVGDHTTYKFCPVVYSTDRSKAVVPVLVLLFVALWSILRGDLLYVFPCVILFLCF